MFYKINKQIGDLRMSKDITLDNLKRGDLFIDGFHVNPPITISFIRKVGGKLRFKRVHEHPAIDGQVIDYNKSDFVYLNPIQN